MRLSDTLPDFTGSLLDDERLEILECLGSGAYGKVYKAVDRTSSPESPSYFAVKCLLKPKAGSREEEFQLREIALHKKVSGHPNILAIHEVLYDDFFVYVILDFCDGGDLFAAITETVTFNRADESVRDVFVQLLDAVRHCHDLGVFHRDLKPENVLCSKDTSYVRIGDFGLSTDKRICQDFGCGSSYYMSPGQLFVIVRYMRMDDCMQCTLECLGKEGQRSSYSPRQNDVWSLGIILINLITSRNPWNLAVSKDQHFASFLENGNYLRDLLPISDEVHHILTRIFELNPLRRISIPALRRAMLDVKSFHRAVLPKSIDTRNSEREVVTHYTDEISSTSKFISELSLSSVQVSVKPVGPTPLDELLSGILRISHHVPKDTMPKSYSRWCGTSVSDSDKSDVGPETPASKAVEPEVEVEIPEMQLDGAVAREKDFPTPKIRQQPFIVRAKAAAVSPPRYLAKQLAMLIR
ncbi:hypothetical protein E1B28_010359 [Marasmius oreades]|uniref:non-specific serine/threonine protein kinase n=1 Tax=Marasmius oreades TaxID=181124 RepID=A0A9P7RWV3_9AGAR|nr:uncharacterized protein E1B28_010359 [Marasmius oreades]KAG7091314.1 hypothetical protein E1B28_010359 [Marasmius oreades]